MSDFQKKTLERIVKTFLVAFLAPVLLAAPSGGLSIETIQAAAIAGVAAAGTLILSLLSKGVGPADSPSLV